VHGKLKQKVKGNLVGPFHLLEQPVRRGFPDNNTFVLQAVVYKSQSLFKGKVAETRHENNDIRLERAFFSYGHNPLMFYMVKSQQSLDVGVKGKIKIEAKILNAKTQKCGHGKAGSRTTGKCEVAVFFDTALDDEVSEKRKYMGKVPAF
jgi:hypothetical protein